jgi:preprotein translocase subunit SecA
VLVSGDPGSSHIACSLEEEHTITCLVLKKKVAKMWNRMGREEVVIQAFNDDKIYRTQKVGRNNFGVRKRLLEYDDVMNAQRGVNTNVVVMLYLENV